MVSFCGETEFLQEVREEVVVVRAPSTKQYIDASGRLWVRRRSVRGRLAALNWEDMISGNSADVDRVEGGLAFSSISSTETEDASPPTTKVMEDASEALEHVRGRARVAGSSRDAAGSGSGDNGCHKRAQDSMVVVWMQSGLCVDVCG